MKPWCVVFEDEGAAGYGYACDGRLATVDDDFDVTVLDGALLESGASEQPNVRLTMKPEGDH